METQVPIKRQREKEDDDYESFNNYKPAWWGNGPQQQQQHSPKSQCLRSRNAEILKNINATGQEIWCAAVELFGIQHLKSFSISKLQHLIFNIEPDLLNKTIFNRRGRSYTRYISQAENWLKLSYGWNFDKMWSTWSGKCRRAVRLEVILNSMWMMWAVPLLHHELLSKVDKLPISFTEMSEKSWQEYYLLLMDWMDHQDQRNVAPKACEIFWNSLLLSNDTVTRQFLTSKPDHKRFLDSSILEQFVKKTTKLDDNYCKKFTIKFMQFYNEGYIFITICACSAAANMKHKRRPSPPPQQQQHRDLVRLPSIAELTSNLSVVNKKNNN